MSHELQYVSPAFFVQRAVAIAPAVVRVRFTYAPKAINPGNADDGLNPSNYSISGSHFVSVSSVSKVFDDPQSVDVFLAVPLAVGLWTIDVSNSIVAANDSTQLTAPTSITFPVSATKTQGPINGGAYSDTASHIIRKHLPSTFAGPAWDAVIEALATGDATNWENAQAAFDQLFVSTASGKYLDRKASDGGVSRPNYIGISDDSFRQYTIRTSADKLTPQAVLQVLETFYGTDAVRAHTVAENTEPYRFEEEDSLFISVNGARPAEIVFRKPDFQQIGKATAIEVAAALNRQFRSLKIPAIATTKQDPESLKSTVSIYSNTAGLGSSIAVFGGFANNSLRFPKQIELGLAANSVFDIDIPQAGYARYTLRGFTEPVFTELEIGDYVNVWGEQFYIENRGTFTITDIQVDLSGSTWTQSFTVFNENAICQATVNMLDTDDVVLFRPVVARPYSGSGVVVSQTSDGIHVVLPATTTVVQRTEFSGAHPDLARTISVQSLEADPRGFTTITTTASHGLSQGDVIEIAGLQTTTSLPAVQGASGTLTGKCPVTATTQIAANAIPTEAVIAPINDVAAMVCGNGFAKRVTVTSFPSDGKQYSVNWLDTATMPSLTGHTATALRGADSGKVLVVGGVGSDKVYLYNSADNTWTDKGVSVGIRSSHSSTLLSDGSSDYLVVFGGKNGNALATNAYKYKDGSVALLPVLPAELGRFSHQAIAINDSSMLVVGGTTPDTDVISSSFVFDLKTNTKTQCGNLCLARKDFAAVKLPSGRVLVIGGSGRNLSNETINRALPECEVWDPSLKSWSSAGSLAHGRTSPVVALVGDKVYVMGGKDGSGNSVTKTEVYDTGTGTWSTLSSLCDSASGTFAGCRIGDVVIGLSSDHVSVLVPNAERSAITGLRGTVQVAAVSSATQFTVSSPLNGYSSSDKGTIVPFAAESATSAGPYVWDPLTSAAITGVEATLAAPLYKGHQYSSLMLGDEEALKFPDKPGWLCVNYGNEGAVAQIPYLGRVSDKELMLDYNFKFPADALTGGRVTLLAGKGPYVPARADSLGSLYVTASSSGRVLAQSAVESILAAGMEEKLTVTVVYPGDKGLGNAGYGTTGNKLSDKVAVWGGNELDAEIEAARENE